MKAILLFKLKPIIIKIDQYYYIFRDFQVVKHFLKIKRTNLRENEVQRFITLRVVMLF